jgi:hypothetical protein
LEIDDPVVRLARALARIERGELDGAAADLTVLVTTQGDVPVSEEAVRAYLRLPGLSTQAPALLDRLIAADPLRWELRVERARLLELTVGAAELRLARELAGANLVDQRPMLLLQWAEVPLLEPVLAFSDEEKAKVQATIALLPTLLDDTLPRAESPRDAWHAGLLTLLGRYKEARDLAAGIVARKETFAVVARQTLAVAHAGLGDVKECLAAIRGTGFVNPFGLEESVVRPARTFLALGNGKSALALLDAAFAKDRIFMDEDTWLLWIRAAIAAGDRKRAYSILADGTKAIPPWDAWRLREVIPLE